MKTYISLDGEWQWKAENENIVNKGTVPGSVLSDMLALGLVEDPYWGTNEYQVKNMFDRDYRYIRVFSLLPEQRKMQRAELVFEGLDTLAQVTLNGTVVLDADDMHRVWHVDVKTLLQDENTLEVLLKSPLRYIEQKDAQGDIFYASTGCQHGNGYLRKAHYMFGWDWGPNLPDAGIWRSVRLELADGAVLQDVRVRQFHANGKVRVTADAETILNSDAKMPLTLRCTLTAPDGSQMCTQAQVRGQKAHAEILVEQPMLWWPNGYGAQPLYGLSVQLVSDRVEDTYSCRLGLRTFTVCTDPDEYEGNQFAFVLNGQKIFAMGANYIPEDNIRNRITPERTRRLIQDCAAANFNCIRVWGGGFYPDDAFYDACDEQGILVWQDLMFACNVYDLDPHFEENILAETKDAVRRLRHHACLALWCGNNEMEWGWASWARLMGHRPKYKADYIKIFELLLPRCVQEMDDQTFYWLSSPSSGGAFDDPNDWRRGDSHYWEVWHSGKPFTEYRKFYFRFCSEYGFQSFPHRRTLESFCKPEDMNLFSEVMESHQKNGAANAKIFTYIADYYRYPRDMESVAYVSQILQLKAIQYGVEHWRRNWGRCMGSIYWQLNDCWPVASWAGIDYYGRWKALHYGAKRFYSRFMASACEQEELSTKVCYYLHNEGFELRHAKLKVRLFDTLLHTIDETEIEVSAKAFETKAVYDVDFAPFLQEKADRKRTAAEYQLLENGRVIGRGTTIFVKPKHFEYQKPHYQAKITDEGNCFAVHISADCFVNYTELSFEHLDAVFSDNYFDITQPEGVTVTITKSQLPAEMTAECLESQLHIMSVADSY